MTADTITAIKKALEGVTPDQVERLWWFLHIISKSGGATDATDDKWNWINAFCHDFEDDTFNRAADLAFISVSFDSIMETSTAKMTPAGNAFIAYFDKAPSASANAAIESLQRENEETLETYYERQIEWSRGTFGPALRTKGIIDHIKKELGEIEADPHDLSEWVDVVILAMDGFWRHGGNAGDLFKALIAKQQKNMARTWPDWRTMSEDSAIEHDRSKDAPRTALSSTGDTHGN